MYLPKSTAHQQRSRQIALLEAAADSDQAPSLEDPEVKDAFEAGLRELAEDIVQFHPGLAHLLIGMSETPCPAVHGQN